MRGIPAQATQENAQLGIFMMLAAYFLFSLIDTSVKWLVIAGIHAFQLAFMRYVGHFVLSLWRVMRGGVTADRFKTDHLGLVLCRGFLLLSSTFLNFWTLNYLPLTIPSSIMFSAPVIVCLLSMPLLGERVGPWRWFAIVLGFAGVLIVIRPFDETYHWAALLTVYNAFALALYSIITRKLAGTVATETMQFYVGAMGTFTLLIPAIWTWKNPQSLLDWLLMAALGI